MKKRFISLIVACTVSSTSMAATKSIVWGEATHSLPQFKISPAQLKTGAIKTISNPQQKHYQLKLENTQTHASQHSRYQLYYHDIPVWGHQLIFHKNSQAKQTVTGINVSDIEKDIPDIVPALSEKDAEKNILAAVKTPVKFKSNTKIIYIDKKDKAHLAYHLTFYTNTPNHRIEAPNYIIDANSGEVLKHWNNAHKTKIGQGLGGNAIQLPYRSGMFQHGDALPGLPSLGKFDVTVKGDRCLVQTGKIRVMNLENERLGYDAFPITVFDEQMHQLGAFSYPCSKDSLYLNYADDTTGPINYSFSPVNDTMYFAAQTLKMYKKVYGIKKPLGNDLPLRAYTHLGEMDNAFAIPTIRINGVLVAHQQIIIGNGDRFLTAPAQAVIGHELSHNFTELNSGLVYDGQSGGINESFSDMAAIALQQFLRKTYSWYWDGEDWSIGREAMINGEPLRYMDDPTKDGMSIGNANDYYEGLDVHYSSGVFNKAFYLLAHKPGWTVEKAFRVMVDANQNYWSPIAYYDFAACGVIQAAIDNRLDHTAVVETFEEVGVHCPIQQG